MQNKLTLEDIARLRTETKDAILLAILADAEYKMSQGREITWHFPEPISPRPWKGKELTYRGYFAIQDANDREVLCGSGDPHICQFIVDRVNAGEASAIENETIHKLQGYIDEVHAYLHRIGVTYQGPMLSRIKIAVASEHDETKVSDLNLDKAIIAQAHSILDAMGVPKAQGQPCDRSDCNSLLIHRLHHVQDNFTNHEDECNAVNAKTVADANQILDEMGIPPSENPNSLAPLLDRIRKLRSRYPYFRFDKFWESTNNHNFFTGKSKRPEGIAVEDLKQVAHEAWDAAIKWILDLH